MPKKETQESFVAKALGRAKRPVDLSQFVYQGSAVKSTAVCPEHGPFQISANALMNRIGCTHCAVKSRADKRRLTQEEFVTRAKAKHGDKYDYSQVVYKSSQEKVTIVCQKHGPFSQGPNSHLSGQGCPDCGNELAGEKCRLPQDAFIAECVKTHGDRYDLSEIEYKGRREKIKVVCKEHGPFYPQAGNFGYAGSGCLACGRSTVGLKSRKKESAYIDEGMKKHNGKFSYGSVRYINTAAYMTIICPIHGRFEQLANDHLKGIGCEKCARPMFDQDSFILLATKIHGNKYNYASVNYEGALTDVTIGCKTHGNFQQTPSSHVNGMQGCPSCAGVGPSKGQVEIYDFLKQHAAVTLEHPLDDSRRRYDIFLPEKNLAIEYHGLIWHSTKFSTDPLRDFKKHKEAEKLGVRVIHIYQDEWAFRSDTVKRTLLSAIGVLPKIHARKTSVIQLDRGDANCFFEDNHLQGAPNSTVFLGLMHNGKLVACMSFAMARSTRSNTDSSLWELQRYAATHTVVGGASKLLKNFLGRKLCHTLISYSDTRAFTGRMYEALGFDFVHETRPDYYYVSTSISDGRKHKSKFQLKHLPAKLKTFDHEKTEVQNCFDNGWYQLFDCGKKKWQMKCE